MSADGFSFWVSISASPESYLDVLQIEGRHVMPLAGSGREHQGQPGRHYYLTTSFVVAT